MNKNIIGIIFMISVQAFCVCACAKEESVYLEHMQVIPKTTEVSMPDTNMEPAFCCVYVCGAVNHPGVYDLEGSPRIQDALEAAGGFSKDADQTSCNLAEYIYDGQKIYFPTVEETTEKVNKQEAANAGKVNLNTATAAELMTIPGIGESKADSILAYRNEHGRFEQIEDIMNITGIKEGIFEKIKDSITVN